MRQKLRKFPHIYIFANNSKTIPQNLEVFPAKSLNTCIDVSNFNGYCVNQLIIILQFSEVIIIQTLYLQWLKYVFLLFRYNIKNLFKKLFVYMKYSISNLS